MEVFTLSPEEKQQVFKLAQRLVGGYTEPHLQHELTVNNLITRIRTTGNRTLAQYLRYVTQNPDEVGFLISALTIHTTSWFRERPHYKNFQSELFKRGAQLSKTKIRLLSVACSTGEEVYSFGFILESLRRKFPGFEYELIGVDLDPVSLKKAESGLYQQEPKNWPSEFDHYVNTKPPSGAFGEESTFIVDHQIRKRTQFFNFNALNLKEAKLGQFDYVVCRNMLIYFSRDAVNQIVTSLLECVKPEGILTLGHCEPIQSERFKLKSIGNSSFKRIQKIPEVPVDFHQKISVLVVDDSPTVQRWLRASLEKCGLTVYTADSAEDATRVLVRQPVDLITLDLNLPGQHGLEWLAERRASGMTTPVIIFTEIHAEKAPEVLGALDGLAQDYLNKASVAQESEKFLDSVTALVHAQRDRRQIATLVPKKDMARGKTPRIHPPDVILIGASTGGTDSIRQILSGFPSHDPDCPPVVIVQHIPNEFAPAFSQRMAEVSGLKIGNSANGTQLEKQTLYMSHDSTHIGIAQARGKLVLVRQPPTLTDNYCPSVEFLFNSATHLLDTKVIALLLTGMGKDGARGLLELRKVGAFTAVQDKGSSAVWGMPGEAVRLGAAEFIGNLQELRQILSLNIRAVRASKTAA
jgi:chemotaxis response regulator CheB/chemotaxis methyl-accepting protein methylase